MTGETSEEHARCAEHPQDHAEVTCERCGNYACQECKRETKRGRRLCMKCYRRYLEIRRDHYRAEHRVQGLAVSFYLIAATWVFVVVSFARFIGRVDGVATWKLIAWLLPGLLLVMAGRGMARLDRRRRPLAILLAGLSLLLVPIGTLLGARILIVLAREPGRFVFSDDYAEVLAAVPDGEPEGRLRRVLFLAAVFSLGLYAVLYLVRYAP